MKLISCAGNKDSLVCEISYEYGFYIYSVDWREYDCTDKKTDKKANRYFRR